MTLVVCRFHVMHPHMQIDRRGFQLRVAQHRLDVAQIAPVLQQGGGKGVSEHVATADFAEVRLADQFVNMSGQPTGMHAIGKSAGKPQLLCLALGSLRTVIAHRQMLQVVLDALVERVVGWLGDLVRPCSMICCHAYEASCPRTSRRLEEKPNSASQNAAEEPPLLVVRLQFAALPRQNKGGWNTHFSSDVIRCEPFLIPSCLNPCARCQLADG